MVPHRHRRCKSMVMVNTRAHASVTDCSDPWNPKYYMVIVQVHKRAASNTSQG